MFGAIWPSETSRFSSQDGFWTWNDLHWNQTIAAFKLRHSLRLANRIDAFVISRRSNPAHPSLFITATQIGTMNKLTLAISLLVLFSVNFNQSIAQNSRDIFFNGLPNSPGNEGLITPEGSFSYFGPIWRGLATPQAGDNAIFDISEAMGANISTSQIRIHLGDFRFTTSGGSGGNAVQAGGIARSENAQVRNGNFILDFDSFNVDDGSGGAYRIDNQLSVVGSSSLTLVASDNPDATHLTTRFFTTGTSQQPEGGRVILDGVNVNSLSGAGFGNADVTIRNGAQLTSGQQLTVGGLSASPGQRSNVTITGEGSLWHNTNTQFWISHFENTGTSRVQVLNGGQLRTGNNVLLGNSQNSTGELLISGNGSVANLLGARVFADSSIRVSNFGVLNAATSLDVAADASADSRIIVETGGSIVTQGDLRLSGFDSQGGDSLLDVGRNSSVSVGRDAFLFRNSTVDLGGGGAVRIRNSAEVAGALTVGNGGRLFGSPTIIGDVIVESGGRIDLFDIEGGAASLILSGDLTLESASAVELFLLGVDDSGSANSFLANGTGGQNEGSQIIGDGGTLELDGTLILDFDGQGTVDFRSFDIFTGFSTVNGQFDNFVNRTGLDLELDVTANGVTLRNLSAVPEPGSLVLICLATACIGMSRRRNGV